MRLWAEGPRRGLRDDFAMTTAQRRRADTEEPSPDQVDAVSRASRTLVGIAAESIAAVDDNVTVPQWRVLAVVDTTGPLNLAAVAAGLDVNPSNASRICDRLIRAGLLDRRESKYDRRNITLSLTAAGRPTGDQGGPTSAQRDHPRVAWHGFRRP
jgi:DNA-binding MarR family transcriptional regulator